MIEEKQEEPTKYDFEWCDKCKTYTKQKYGHSCASHYCRECPECGEIVSIRKD